MGGLPREDMRWGAFGQKPVTSTLPNTGNAAATAREPTAYATQSYTRLMDEIEAIKTANGGRLPARWVEDVAVKTGYEPTAIRALMSRIRSGDIPLSPELQQRAMTLKGSAADRRGQGDMAIIEELMDKGLPNGSILERLNAIRAGQGKGPSTSNSVRQAMWRIRTRRNGGDLSGLGLAFLGGYGAQQEFYPR